jgi:osmotically-inducible protein OsmY
VRFYNITIRSVDHVVYLNGQVDSERDSGQAGDIARGVPRVKNVYNDLYLSNG